MDSSNQKIAVSVIVPVYNVEIFLRRCLDSLVHQTLEDIEIILVNDCSPDHSWDIMQEYKDLYSDKIILINSPENRRQGGARNLGIRAAKGEYIGFVDSDDWVEMDMYEKLYKKAVEENSDVVACNYDCIDGVNAVIHQSIKINENDDMGRQRKSLIIKPGPICTKIYKKELLLDNQLFFPEHKFYEDNMWVPLVACYVRHVSQVEEVLHHYFIHNASTTHLRNDERSFERLDTMILFWNEVQKRELYAQYKEEVEYVFICGYFVNSMYVCRNSFDNPRIDKLEEMRKTLRLLIPDYRRNKYYQKLQPGWIKIYVSLCMYSPRLYISVKNIIRKIKS